MVPRIEDVDEVIVGKRYSVPVVIRKWTPVPKALKVVPVIGPLHEDAEFIGFADRHWHPDRRFLPKLWFDNEPNHWAVVFTPFPYKTVGALRPPQEAFVIDGGRRVMTCKRLVDTFCHATQSAERGFPVPPSWLKKMEPAYKNQRLRNMICPHRGISCVGVKPEADGGIVCPGHGLKWNPKTGELMSRCGQDFRQRNLLGPPFPTAQPKGFSPI